jgi:hypothetical protein
MITSLPRSDEALPGRTRRCRTCAGGFGSRAAACRFPAVLSLRLQSQTVPPAVTRDTRQPRSLIPVVGNDVAVSRNEEGHNLKVTLVQFGIVCQQLAHIAVLALAGGYVSQRVQDCGETQDALQPLCECPQCRAQAR